MYSSHIAATPDIRKEKNAYQKDTDVNNGSEMNDMIDTIASLKNTTLADRIHDEKFQTIQRFTQEGHDDIRMRDMNKTY